MLRGLGMSMVTGLGNGYSYERLLKLCRRRKDSIQAGQESNN